VTPGSAAGLVSVVIAVRDRHRQLPEAVDSVLTQTGVDVEVVVVDDGSTDGTAEVADGIAARFDAVRVVHQANAGPSAARNTGVGVSSGHWLTFLDSDDLMMPGRLAAQVGELQRLGPRSVVMGEEHIEIADGVVAPPSISAAQAQPRPRWYTMTMMTTRSVFDDVGGFDESLRIGEDTELLFRMHRHGAVIARFEQIWTHRRIFGDNLVYDDVALRRTSLTALRMNLPERPS
jgi:glycosyltransferase involved in cell wall biosynthesis